jgi:hypothetical protein
VRLDQKPEPAGEHLERLLAERGNRLMGIAIVLTGEGAGGSAGWYGCQADQRRFTPDRMRGEAARARKAQHLARNR